MDITPIFLACIKTNQENMVGRRDLLQICGQSHSSIRKEMLYDESKILAKKKVDEILDVMAPAFFCNIGSPDFPNVSEFEVMLENQAQLKAAGQEVPSHVSIKCVRS